MAEMAGRRTVRRWWPLLFALLATASVPSVASASPPAGWASWNLAPGVEHLLTERPGLVAHAARIRLGAPVALRPIVAFDRIGGGHGPHDGRQPVSELCRRAGGIVCVNADFFNCQVCGQPAGGLVDRTRPLRSFLPNHEQVSIVGGRPTFDGQTWLGSLHGAAGKDAFRLRLASLNRGPMPDGAVLYTPDWGPTTPQVAGQVELVLASGGPYFAGIRDAVPVGIRPTSGVIPRDGVVIAANGRAAEKLNWLWQAWHATHGARRLVLDTALSEPADISIGGHPILLRDGVRQPLDPHDGMTVGRHPRTILAWTRSADLLLVAIDGRQPGYSDGATLSEATDLLIGLGATNAINLDGGGSTTFVLPCNGGACVANRPSDGHERPVPVALAVVPVRDGSGVLSAAGVASDERRSAPTTAPPPAAPVPPTTTTPTTTSTTVPRLQEPATSMSARHLELPDETAVEAPRPVPVSTNRPDPVPTAALGVVAIAAWSVAAWRLLRRRSPGRGQTPV